MTDTDRRLGRHNNILYKYSRYIISIYNLHNIMAIFIMYEGAEGYVYAIHIYYIQLHA